MKRRAFVRNVGLSAAGLAVYPGKRHLWSFPTAGATNDGGNQEPVGSVETAALRLGYRDGTAPFVTLFVKRERGWDIACTLDTQGLRNIKLFATQFPFTNDQPQWNSTRKSDRSLTMASETGGRKITHEFDILDDPARLRVRSALSLLGDELLEWFQDRWTFSPGSPLDFAFAPCLRPDDDMVIGDHVFRAPAVVLLKDKIWTAMVPDLDSLGNVRKAHTMSADFDLLAGTLPVFAYGLKAYQPVSHTFFRHADSMLFCLPKGEVEFTYEILAGADEDRASVTRRVVSYHWQTFGRKYVASVLPQTVPFFKYAGYSYPTLFRTGAFHEVGTAAEKSGGFSALNDGGYFRRPEKVLQNQAWFNNMRSSYGLFHFGRKTRNKEWQEHAVEVRRWTLSAPQTDGLFPAMYDYEKNEWWGSVPRLNGGRNRIECVDAAWTAVWLMWWNRDFGGNDSSLNRVRSLADFFVANQLPSGAIPAWFDLPAVKGDRPRPVDVLKESAETAGSAMLLGELALRTGEHSYVSSLTRAADFLVREVIPEMKYWDFETYWSCSWKPLDMRDGHTGILPQNTLSAYWTVHSLLRAFEVTGVRKYLDGALESLDVLNFYQQVWNPPWLDLYTFGGFGVMNTDGEWNDSRQAVFAPVYLDAYRLTGETEYFERGVAALRASFVLMAIPENKTVSPRSWNALPTGLCPENFAHGGYNGEFARSDPGWGEAGALSAAALVENGYGGVYLDTERGKGFGIDGCRLTSLKKSGNGFEIEVAELLGHDREVTIVTDTGKRISLTLRANRSTDMSVET